MSALAFVFTAWSVSAAENTKKTEISQEISIKAEGVAGPSIQVPRPRPDKEVVDEVVRSLDLYKGEHKGEAPGLTVPAGSRRLSRPFPEAPYLVFNPSAVQAPYDSWIFEVVSGAEVVWRTEGAGRIKEPIEWDGTGSAGDTVIRVEKAYRFRFTGKNGPAEFAIASEPVTLKSLSYREYLGETRLEVATSALFARGKAAFGAGSDEFLAVIADRLRRVDAVGSPYRFLLYDAAPKAELARARARKLKDYFSKLLLINPKLVEIDVLTAGARGESAVCVLPVEKGSAIRND